MTAGANEPIGVVTKFVIFGAFEVKMKKFVSSYQSRYSLESTTLRTLQYLKRWASPAGCCDEH